MNNSDMLAEKRRKSSSKKGNSVLLESIEYAKLHGGRFDVLSFADEMGYTFDQAFSAADLLEDEGVMKYARDGRFRLKDEPPLREVRSPDDYRASKKPPAKKRRKAYSRSTAAPTMSEPATAHAPPAHMSDVPKAPPPAPAPAKRNSMEVVGYAIGKGGYLERKDFVVLQLTDADVGALETGGYFKPDGKRWKVTGDAKGRYDASGHADVLLATHATEKKPRRHSPRSRRERYVEPAPHADVPTLGDDDGTGEAEEVSSIIDVGEPTIPDDSYASELAQDLDGAGAAELTDAVDTEAELDAKVRHEPLHEPEHDSDTVSHEPERYESGPVSLEEARSRIDTYFRTSGDESIGWPDFRELGIVQRVVNRLEEEGFLRRMSQHAFERGNGRRPQTQALTTSYGDGWSPEKWEELSKGKTVAPRGRSSRGTPETAAPESLTMSPQKARLSDAEERSLATYFLERSSGGRYTARMEELVGAGFSETAIRTAAATGIFDADDKGFLLSEKVRGKYQTQGENGDSPPAQAPPSDESKPAGSDAGAYRRRNGGGEDYLSRPPANAYERALRALDKAVDPKKPGAHGRMSRYRFVIEAGGKENVKHLLDMGYVRSEKDERGDVYFTTTHRGIESLRAGTIR